MEIVFIRHGQTDVNMPEKQPRILMKVNLMLFTKAQCRER